jgi:hypothetical protein
MVVAAGDCRGRVSATGEVVVKARDAVARSISVGFLGVLLGVAACDGASDAQNADAAATVSSETRVRSSPAGDGRWGRMTEAPRAVVQTSPAGSDAVAPCLSGTDTLQEYARKCMAAMNNVAIPGFVCDDDGAQRGHTASTEPLRQGAPGAVSCDAPNVLNGECDAGSKFHMLHRNNNNDGIYIAAHCRKQEHAPGEFGDIAMIAYNAKTGATCFFQALGFDTASGTLPGDVKPPSQGTSLNGLGGAYPWRTPAGTASVQCVRCHDNGPFVRSPYLAQLGNIWPAASATHDPNYLPGTIDAELTWNSDGMPYRFVGLDFQGWEAYTVKTNNNSSSASTCTGCHRLGVSQILTAGVATRFPDQGTSLDFALQATAPEGDSHYQHSKTPTYSASSPIWMTPGNIDATPWTKPGVQGPSLDPTDPAVNLASAQHTAGCAGEFANSTSAVPATSPNCYVDRFARGDTCTGPSGGVINGGTKSTVTDYTSDVEIPLGCANQPGCAVGFYYWTSLHGPFYQQSAASVPFTSGSFIGSALRIAVKNGSWVVQEKLNAQDFQQGGKPSPGAPGGTYGGIGFSRIASVPNVANCGSGIVLNAVADPTGGQATTTATLFSPASASLAILSGFIGNVATDRSSALRVNDIASPDSTVLSQVHIVSPSVAQWFTGEAWNNSCASWAPSAHYAAQNVLSNNDVQLVASSVAPHAICYLTGIGGNWADSRPDGMGGMNQPYAKIYQGAGGDLRLQVWPPSASDRGGVFAYASCLNIDS